VDWGVLQGPEEQTIADKNMAEVLTSVTPPACWWEGTRFDRPCSKNTKSADWYTHTEGYTNVVGKMLL
jgi:hypothetical protein